MEGPLAPALDTSISLVTKPQKHSRELWVLPVPRLVRTLQSLRAEVWAERQLGRGLASRDPRPEWPPGGSGDKNGESPALL